MRPRRKPWSQATLLHPSSQDFRNAWHWSLAILQVTMSSRRRKAVLVFATPHVAKALLAQNNVDIEQHSEIDSRLKALISEDEYFAESEMSDPVWCLSHITYVRNSSDMKGSVEEVQEDPGLCFSNYQLFESVK